MAFGKLVVFLIISLKISAEVCCDDWECSLIPDSGNCTSAGCVFENNACRKSTCSDRTNSNCEYSGCKLTGSTCGEAPSCSNWNDRQSDCNSKYDTTDGSSCIWSGSACIKWTCGFHTSDGQSSCESEGCKWANNACVNKTCGDTNCDFPTYIGNDICFYNGTVCKAWNFTCGELSATTNPACSDLGCKLDGGVCREPKCSDYNSDPTTCFFATGCEYDTTGTTCNTVAPVACSSHSTYTSCDANGCYYLKSCPVKDDGDSAASGIFAPALLVALLLVLHWL